MGLVLNDTKFTEMMIHLTEASQFIELVIL